LAAAGCAQASNGTPSKGSAIQTYAQDITEAETIGSATEEADGTIVLRLRATGAGGAVGDGRLRYPRTHPRYAMIKAHVGPIPAGGSVAVKPFPDK